MGVCVSGSSAAKPDQGSAHKQLRHPHCGQLTSCKQQANRWESPVPISSRLSTVRSEWRTERGRRRAYPNSPTFDTAGLQLSYIVDFWGQYRRATEAARAATCWRTEYARHLVETTLVASVASTYFQLRQLDSQLEFSQETVVSDQDSLRINTINYKGGEYAITDVYQAKLLVAASRGRGHHAQAGDRADRKSA